MGFKTKKRNHYNITIKGKKYDEGVSTTNEFGDHILGIYPEEEPSTICQREKSSPDHGLDGDYEE